jgi:hypothetical protein
MLRKRSLTTHLLLFLAIAAPVAAQQHRLYVFGAGGLVIRQMPTYETDDTPLNRSGIWGLSAGGGMWVRRMIGIEGSIAFQQPQHVKWSYNYQFASEAKQLDTADRDVPILGRLRYAARAGGRVGTDLIVGGGWTWHRAASKVLATCGVPSRFEPCVTLAQPRDDETFATWEPALAAGIDVPIRLSSRVALAPSFQAVFSQRRQFMTGYDHRGPVSGSGAVFSIGTVVSWRDR